MIETSAPGRRTAEAAPTGQVPGGTAATLAFTDHRELLFSIVYNILGSIADTEDVLQETWLSWTARVRRMGLADIDNPRAYLVRIAVNQALGRQESIRRRRETYIGPWLPEPLVEGRVPATAEPVAADERAMRNESVSMALLVVLETLSPLERAVFVLHEVFGYAHTEIAEVLDRTPAAVRQVAHRARSHVHTRRPRYAAHPRVRQEATERFVSAALGGDVAKLMEILAPDVTVWTDGGGKAKGPGPRPVRGREKATRLLATMSSVRNRVQNLDVRYATVNGDASAVVLKGDSPFAVMVFDLTPDGEQVSDVYIVVNPDKLTAFQLDRDDEEYEEWPVRAGAAS